MSLEEYDLDRESGHCAHCCDECKLDPEPREHQDAPCCGAKWCDGHCPACAAVKIERARVVEWLRFGNWGECCFCNSDAHCAADGIEQGKHLEES